MYYEDADYSVRAKESGFPLFHAPVLGILHRSVRSRPTRVMEYYLARNHLLFVKRLAPRTVQWYEMLRMPKIILEHIMKKEYEALMGVKDYIIGSFGKEATL
jgi:GT2 family glycosyltransferase